MGWRDLIEVEEQEITAPWFGGRSLRYHSRHLVISGRMPPHHGWHKFRIWHKEAKFLESTDPKLDELGDTVSGFLIGDKIVIDNVSGTEAARITDLGQLAGLLRQVHLIEDGLDRFARVEVGMYGGDSQTVPLIYRGQAFPLGPEDEVMAAYLDRKDSVSDVKGVTPALDVAFRMETLHRAEVEKRRVELERLRRAETERLAKEERRRELQERLGDGAGRREMATVDFTEAARAALAVGGAELLDVRSVRGEKIVKYRVDGRRYECICDSKMQIIDAGICLQDHDTGEKGDTFFTLESLPAVIKQAIDEDKLVVWRHV